VDGHLLTGALALAPLTMAPGADTALVTQITLSQSRRAAVAAHGLAAGRRRSQGLREHAAR
jgi:threonine/homoserine/homoserine lactone efflux protein